MSSLDGHFGLKQRCAAAGSRRAHRGGCPAAQVDRGVVQAGDLGDVAAVPAGAAGPGGGGGSTTVRPSRPACQSAPSSRADRPVAAGLRGPHAPASRGRRAEPRSAPGAGEGADVHGLGAVRPRCSPPRFVAAEVAACSARRGRRRRRARTLRGRRMAGQSSVRFRSTPAGPLHPAECQAAAAPTPPLPATVCICRPPRGPWPPARPAGSCHGAAAYGIHGGSDGRQPLRAGAAHATGSVSGRRSTGNSAPPGRPPPTPAASGGSRWSPPGTEVAVVGHRRRTRRSAPGSAGGCGWCAFELPPSSCPVPGRRRRTRPGAAGAAHRRHVVEVAADQLRVEAAGGSAASSRSARRAGCRCGSTGGCRRCCRSR